MFNTTRGWFDYPYSDSVASAPRPLEPRAAGASEHHEVGGGHESCHLRLAVQAVHRRRPRHHATARRQSGGERRGGFVARVAAFGLTMLQYCVAWQDVH